MAPPRVPANAARVSGSFFAQTGGPLITGFLPFGEQFRQFIEIKLNSLSELVLARMRTSQWSPWETGCLAHAIGYSPLRVVPGGRSQGGTYFVDLDEVPYGAIQEFTNRRKAFFLLRGARLASVLWQSELATLRSAQRTLTRGGQLIEIVLARTGIDPNPDYSRCQAKMRGRPQRTPKTGRKGSKKAGKQQGTKKGRNRRGRRSNARRKRRARRRRR